MSLKYVVLGFLMSSFLCVAEGNAWIPRECLKDCDSSCSHIPCGYVENENLDYSLMYLVSDSFFSAGVSSYQGTSTGPGPNGGYPGTPRGIYETNYVNRSIYPNSYMNEYRR